MGLRDKVFPAQGGLPDFVRRFDGAGPGSLGDDETMQHYLEVATELPAELYERVAEESLARLSEPRRRELVEHLRQQARLRDINFAGLLDDIDLGAPARLARLLARMHEQDVGMLPRIVDGAGHAFGSPIAKMLFASIAALGAKSLLGGYGAPVPPPE